MGLKVSLRETKQTIGRKVNQSLADIFNRVFRRNRFRMERDVKSLIPHYISTSPEMLDLAQNSSPGSLLGQFGLLEGTGKEAVNAIVDAVSRSIEVRITNVSPRDLSGGITFNFVPANFRTIIGIPEGIVITEKGVRLDWLEWLLTKGDTIIIQGFHYRAVRDGRSGAGLMIKRGLWRVPTQFSGVLEDNFITRALQSPQFERDVQNAITKNIR